MSKRVPEMRTNFNFELGERFKSSKPSSFAEKDIKNELRTRLPRNQGLSFVNITSIENL